VAGWQVADAAWTASSAGLTGFISVQNEYSLLDRSIEAEVVLACERFGLGVLPYFPLAQGLLTGKFRRGEPAAPGTRLANRPEVLDRADWDVVEALAAFAEERDMGLLDVAVGWLAAQPAVASVIAGATRPEQVRANVAAAEWIPSVEDLAALDAITAPQR
jgi:aryl-alcohol dehydrogenase-like predicted oxidoreductase